MTSAAKDKLTVLIATNDKATRKNLMAVLDESDYHAVIVDNCKDALEMLLEQEFDFTIFDPDVEPLTGSDAVEIIKKICPTLPVIVATDEKSYEDGLKIAKSGVYFRIGKPLETNFTRTLLKTMKTKLTDE